MSDGDSQGGNTADTGGKHARRRGFLKTVGGVPAALMASQLGCSSTVAADPEPKLPRIRFGPYSLSRLICGANPFNAGSHLSVFVNHQMRRYFTPEQVLKTLRRCQQVGINCWQSGLGNLELYRRFVDEGGQMHYIAIESRSCDGSEYPAIGFAQVQ